MRQIALNQDDAMAARRIKTVVGVFRRHFPSCNARHDLEPVVMMGLGWCIRMCRTAEAIVLLHRHALDAEASPLSRSLMEHVVKMRWLVETQSDALDAIEHEHRRYQRLLRESANRGGWALDSEDRELPPSDLEMDVPIEGPTFKSVEQVIIKHGDPAWYPIYRLESAASHATYLSAAVYATSEQTDEAETRLQWDPVVRGATIHVALGWLLMGLSQLAEISEMPPEMSSVLERTRIEYEKELG